MMGAPLRRATQVAMVMLTIGAVTVISGRVSAADSDSDTQPGQTSSKAAARRIEQVVVTGSRLPTTEAGATQEVQVYSEEAIRQSGQTTVADFLNTLPVVSEVVDPGSLQTGNAVTGVRLHGMQLGTALVLIDGRRVATSAAGAFNDIFDLNNIPLAAIERIEVLPQGSSAIYGSDAIAGVVNIILKKDLEGLTASIRYGTANHTDALTASVSWGQRWERGSVSLVGSYLRQGELIGKDRALTANANYTAFGSRDARFTVGNPGNVFSVDGSNLPGVGAPYAAVPQGFAGTPTQAEFVATAGQLNKFSLFSEDGLIPQSDRAGLLATGTFDLTPHIQLFSQLLYSHVEQNQHGILAGFLNGSPGFQSFTVSAANPFNPFGKKVGIGYAFPGVSRDLFRTDALVPTLGARGDLGSAWNWEVAAWGYVDRESKALTDQPNSAAVQAALNSSNPATALNPFVAGAPGSPQLVNSVLFTDRQKFIGNTFNASALLRGTPIRLPAGELSVAVGAEFAHTTFSANDEVTGKSADNLIAPTVHRNNYGVFAETKIPVLASLQDQSEDLLDVAAAGRFDHYDDFGGHWTGEAGAALHPLDGLSLRAHWSEAFKAPSLYQLFVTQSLSVTPLIDPLTGKSTGVTVISGGNPSLKPESGQAHSFDLVYADALIPHLSVSVSNWSIHERNSIQALSPQIVVNNANNFPGAVVRAPNCVGGPPCPIISVNRTFTNFGTIEVAGLDYLLDYGFSAAEAEWQLSLNATQTYQYDVAFQPGQPTTDRVSRANDDSNWAPEWKGTAAVQAQRDEWSGVIAARYTGPYRDYDPLLNGTFLHLGDLWYFDANVKYGLERLAPASPWLANAALEIGAVNVFDRQPQFSNEFSGAYGFDTHQADMRGRFVYLQLDGHW